MGPMLSVADASASASKGRVSCCPLKENCCSNTLHHRQADSHEAVPDNVLTVGANLSSTSSDDSPYNSSNSSELYVSPSCCSNGSVTNMTNNVSDKLNVNAPLLHSKGGSCNNAWCQWWEEVIHHTGNHYFLPGGATGCHYIDVLQAEVQQLAVGNYVLF